MLFLTTILLSSISASSPTKLHTKRRGRRMPKWCTSDTPTLLLAVLLDDFVSLCTFLASHPLHLAYLLFFLPYLVQLLSFLSPLLLSTSLLLLVLLTVSPYLDEVPPAPPEFLGRTCCIVLNILKDKLHGNGRIDLLEQFASMFLPPIHDASPTCQESAAQATFGEFFKGNSSDHEAEEGPAVMFSCENAKENQCLASKVVNEESSLGASAGETPSDGEHPVPNSDTSSQSMANETEVINGAAEHGKGMLKIQEVLSSDRKVKQQTRSMSSIPMHSTSETTDSLHRYGSARKEKEWKRTLACKLYEERMTYKLCKERQVAEGDEEMDLLWEAYEANASQADTCKKKEKKAKRVELEEEEEEVEEEEDEEATVGQLCCLQALRLTTGKMNLGMGKRNLMKISKVLKGMKMFTRSSSKK